MTRTAKRRLGLAALSLILLGLAIGGVLVACVTTIGDGPRRVVAGELTTEIIVPTYDEVVVSAEALDAAITAFVAAPSEATLAPMRAAWKAARIPWKQTDAFRFGPISLQGLGTQIDQFPVDPPKIDDAIASASVYEDAYFDNIGANKKGFHGIEYLIFGATTVELFTTDPLAERRKGYLAGCGRTLAATSRELRDAWSEYAGLLATPGSDNATFPTIKTSIDALVNETVFQAEVIADARIGKPKGTASGGDPQPALQESAPSDTSVEDMANALISIRNVYYGSRDGTPGKGIGQLVAANNAATDHRVRIALTSAADAIAAIPTPYTQALVEKRPEIETAYAAMQELQHVLATEVIATLGATLKFNDNDGD